MFFANNPNSSCTHSNKQMLVPKSYRENLLDQRMGIHGILNEEEEEIAIDHLENVETKWTQRKAKCVQKKEASEKKCENKSPNLGRHCSLPGEVRLCDCASHDSWVVLSVAQERGEPTTHLSYNQQLACIRECYAHAIVAWAIPRKCHKKFRDTKEWISKVFKVNGFTLWDCMVVHEDTCCATVMAEHTQRAALEEVVGHGLDDMERRINQLLTSNQDTTASTSNATCIPPSKKAVVEGTMRLVEEEAASKDTPVFMEFISPLVDTTHHLWTTPWGRCNHMPPHLGPTLSACPVPPNFLTN